MSKVRKKTLKLHDFLAGIESGDRVVLSQAITLVESQLIKDQILAEELINLILPKTGNSIRIGITGVPGVGKSTFIESFGQLLADDGKKIAVLTIDPTSQVTRGSILGDKTRMEKLSNHPSVYIRPSASGNALGGVSGRTREAMLLCEAAGFDIILIETVGVGQSETSVFSMVDFFLLLMLAGAGDELQGMKRGIMEMADAIAITKSDGENIKKSNVAKAEYQSALHLMPPKGSGWAPKVVTCSAVQDTGLSDIWEMIQQHQNQMKEKGVFSILREEKNLQWLDESLNFMLQYRLKQHPEVSKTLPDLQEKVRSGQISGTSAARMILERLS